MRPRGQFWRFLHGRLASLVVLAGMALPIEFAELTYLGEPYAKTSYAGSELLLNVVADPSVPLNAVWDLSAFRTFARRERWLHVTYLAAFGLAFAGGFLPTRSKRALLVGVLGVGGVTACLLGMRNTPFGFWTLEPTALRLGLGSILALGGFLALALDGVLAMRRRKDPAPAVFE